MSSDNHDQLGLTEQWAECQGSIIQLLESVKTMPEGDPWKLVNHFLDFQNGTLDINEMPGYLGFDSKISVPIQKLDKCGVCSGTIGLRLCNSCASAIYCSKECQRADWKNHKQFCSQTEQINLKFFYPLIAFLFDSLRRPLPISVESLPKDIDPRTLSAYQSFGYHKELRPIYHPALSQRIIRATLPGARKATQSDNLLHHTVVLGDTHDLRISRIPGQKNLATWWRGKALGDAMRLYLHIVRETDVLEITVAVSFLLLSEIYSTRLTKPRNGSDPDSLIPFSEWEERSHYRLEFGHSPVSDFGICSGRIQGKANRLQTWTYYDPKASMRTTILDPDNHYWMYFRTIKGEDIILDCCSSPYGMTTCVDASHCLKSLPNGSRDWGSTRTPAYFHPSNHSENSHVLIEEKRFSVMQNKLLHGALSWDIPGAPKDGQREHLRQFIELIQGKPCTPNQDERIQDYQAHGCIVLDQILREKCWKGWDKPNVYSRDESFDSGKLRRDLFMKGSRDDSEYNGKLNGYVCGCGGSLSSVDRLSLRIVIPVHRVLRLYLGNHFLFIRVVQRGLRAKAAIRWFIIRWRE